MNQKVGGNFYSFLCAYKHKKRTFQTMRHLKAHSRVGDNF